MYGTWNGLFFFLLFNQPFLHSVPFVFLFRSSFSIPHLVGVWIFFSTLWFSFTNANANASTKEPPQKHASASLTPDEQISSGNCMLSRTPTLSSFPHFHFSSHFIYQLIILYTSILFPSKCPVLDLWRGRDINRMTNVESRFFAKALGREMSDL